MTDGPIIPFDAQCVLCSVNARFILRHDRRHRFRVAAMQGAAGAALLRRHAIDPTDPDTILVVEGDHVLRDSDAVIAIYVGLGWAGRGGLRGRHGWCRLGCATGPTDGSPATAIDFSVGDRRAGFQRQRMPVGFYHSRKPA